MTHRRIKARHVAQSETALIAAAIAGEQRHGFIDGVEVDFRHPDLPASDWEAAAWWYVWGVPPRNAGIIFPAEAELDLDALREAKGMMGAALVPVFARAGDRVSIINVVPKIEDRRFDHPHDAQQRLAYLQIERPSGEIVCPPAL